VILEAYSAGVDAAGVCRLMEDPERSSDALAWAESATAELDIRGQDCEVKVTSFISSRFCDELLFFTMNHPTNHLLGFMAQQITEFIGIPGSIDHRRIPDEILGSTFYPLHANHVRALELEFVAELVAGSAPFKIRGVTYESAEAVRMFFDYYSAHPELVAVNLESPGV
jgi:polysaccharide biosynthesis acetyltransferase WcbI-like protein